MRNGLYWARYHYWPLQVVAETIALSTHSAHAFSESVRLGTLRRNRTGWDSGSPGVDSSSETLLASR